MLIFKDRNSQSVSILAGFASGVAVQWPQSSGSRSGELFVNSLHQSHFTCHDWHDPLGQEMCKKKNVPVDKFNDLSKAGWTFQLLDAIGIDASPHPRCFSCRRTTCDIFSFFSFLSLVCFPLTEELVLEESPKWRLVSEVLAEIERDDADNDKCTCYT